MVQQRLNDLSTLAIEYEILGNLRICQLIAVFPNIREKCSHHKGKKSALI